MGQDAQRRPRRLEGQPLAEANGWLERYRAIWEASFERLDGLLEELQRAAAARGGRGSGRRNTETSVKVNGGGEHADDDGQSAGDAAQRS